MNTPSKRADAIGQKILVLINDILEYAEEVAPLLAEINNAEPRALWTDIIYNDLLSSVQDEMRDARRDMASNIKIGQSS